MSSIFTEPTCLLWRAVLSNTFRTSRADNSRSEAHTTIAAHLHRDDRMATVVSGTWHFGYGNRFDEGALKSLQPGSVYSEPGGMNHFARTDAEPVLVQISGFGPTDTRYFDPADTPKAPSGR